MRKKHSVPKQRLVESGVTVYGIGSLDGVEYNETTDAIIEGVVEVFNSNHKRISGFFGYRQSKRPRKDLTELVLPEDVDPQAPVLQLAKSALVNYGGEFFASVDTAKSMVSNSATDQASKELEDLASTRSFGFIFLVQRHADMLNPRIERLRAEVSRLAVPSMHVLALSASESQPPRPPQAGPQSGADIGPGLDIL
jgi:hypothetical protein